MLNNAVHRQLDIDLLRTFHLACELGTLRAVAERRHLTLGAVSQQIKRLETLLDRRLLERGRQGVTPTARGLQLQADSRAVVAAHDDLVDRLAAHRVGGVVRLGLPEVYTPRLLDELLPRLRRAHPELSLQVRTESSGALRRLLDEDALDIAVTVTAATEPQGGVPLWRTRPIWAAGTTAVLAAGDPLPLALHPPDCPYRQLGLNALDAAHRAWAPAFTSASMAAIEAAVEAGVAVGILDRSRLTPRMRELTPRDGLPALADCTAVLVESPITDDTRATPRRIVFDALASARLAGAPEVR